MNCSNCGKKLKGNENFCRICGTPVKKEENIEETKEEVLEEKVELTDNIDVSKIKVASDNNINSDDTMDVDITNKNNNKELSAMIEITNTKEDDTLEEEKPEKKKRGRKAKEKETDSSKKIKEILAELKPEVEGEAAKENVEEVIDEMKEPTSIIPDDLIKEYKKKEESEESKEDDNKDTEVKDETKEEENKETEVKEDTKDEKDDNAEEVKETTDSAETKEVEQETEEAKDETKEEPFVEITETKEETEDLDKSIITIDDEKTVELDKDKTEAFNKPIITLEESDEDEFNDVKSSSGIVFGILFFLALAGCGVLFYLYTCANKDMKDYKDKYNKLNKEPKTEEQSNNASNKQEPKSNDTIEYNGYLIKNIDNTTNSIVENKLVFTGSKNTIAISIKSDTKYSTIKYAKDDYKTALESDNYEVQSYGTKVTDKVEYVVYELKDKQGNYYLVAYTKLTEDDTIAFILSNKGNTIDYDLLFETNKIVSSTKENKDNMQYNIKLFTKED